MTNHFFTDDKKYNIGREEIVFYIHKKLNSTILMFHISGVISILIEEIRNELLENKKIEIFNFGKLTLKNRKERTFFSNFLKKEVLKKEKVLLHFKILNRVRLLMFKYIDINSLIKIKEFKKGDKK